jgi:hypothetical protein
MYADIAGGGGLTASQVWYYDLSNALSAVAGTSTAGSHLLAAFSATRPAVVGSMVWGYDHDVLTYTSATQTGKQLSNIELNADVIVGDTPNISNISLALASVASNVWYYDLSNALSATAGTSTAGSHLLALAGQSHASVAAVKAGAASDYLTSVASNVWNLDASDTQANSIGSLVVAELDGTKADVTTIVGDTPGISTISLALAASNLQSMIWAANISDISSKLGAGVSDTAASMLAAAGGAGATASQIASVVWSDSTVSGITGSSTPASVLYALLSRTATSQLQSVVWGANISDITSKLGAGVSDTAGSMLAAAGGAGATASQIASVVWSDFESKVGSTVSNMYADIAGGGGLTASQVWFYDLSDALSSAGAGSASTVGSMLFAEIDGISSAVNAIPTTDLSAAVAAIPTTDLSAAVAAIPTDDISNMLSAATASVLVKRLGASVASQVQSGVWGAELSNCVSRYAGVSGTNMAELMSDIESNVVAIPTSSLKSFVASTVQSQLESHAASTVQSQLESFMASTLKSDVASGPPPSAK